MAFNFVPIAKLDDGIDKGDTVGTYCFGTPLSHSPVDTKCTYHKPYGRHYRSRQGRRRYTGNCLQGQWKASKSICQRVPTLFVFNQMNFAGQEEAAHSS